MTMPFVSFHFRQRERKTLRYVSLRPSKLSVTHNLSLVALRLNKIRNVDVSIVTAFERVQHNMNYVELKKIKRNNLQVLNSKMSNRNSINV